MQTYEEVIIDQSLQLLLQRTRGEISIEEYRSGLAKEEAKREELLRTAGLLDDSEDVS